MFFLFCHKYLLPASLAKEGYKTKIIKLIFTDLILANFFYSHHPLFLIISNRDHQYSSNGQLVDQSLWNYRSSGSNYDLIIGTVMRQTLWPISMEKIGFVAFDFLCQCIYYIRFCPYFVTWTSTASYDKYSLIARHKCSFDRVGIWVRWEHQGSSWNCLPETRVDAGL